MLASCNLENASQTLRSKEHLPMLLPEDFLQLPPEAATFTGPKEASILQGFQHVMHVDPHLVG